MEIANMKYIYITSTKLYTIIYLAKGQLYAAAPFRLILCFSVNAVGLRVVNTI